MVMLVYYLIWTVSSSTCSNYKKFDAIFSLSFLLLLFFFFFDYLNYTRFLFILSLHTTCSQSFSCLYENGCYELTMKCKLCQRYSFDVCLCVCVYFDFYRIIYCCCWLAGISPAYALYAKSCALS